MPLAQNYQPLELGVDTHNSPFYCANIARCFPDISSYNFPSKVQLTSNFAGALFALGWWIFIDGAVYYSTYKNEANKAIEVEDVLPGIFSTFALIIVNLINKESLNASDYEFGSSNVATKARGCAFFGVTMSITSIIGGVILCIFKLNEKEYSYAPSYLGISIALQNILIFIGSMFLWFGRNSTESSGF